MKFPERIMPSVRILYYSSMTISKGQTIAPVGQIVSHWRHQPQSSVSMTVTTVSTSTRALQAQASIQSPHPLHFSGSISGISTNYIPSHLFLLILGFTPKICM